LITGLPPSKGYDAILTIVDHGCSRAAIFLPCKTNITGIGIAELYYQHVYPWFGIPHKMISDRDPRFTSHFGRALKEKLGIVPNLSTAFHPQTDGLAERTNQWVEQYLRLVTSAHPDKWAHYLPLAMAVHNNKQNSALKIIPNEVMWGHTARLLPEDDKPSTNHALEDRIQGMKQVHKNAIDAINQLANNKGAPIPQFQKGDKVWLEAHNLKPPYGTPKLLPRRYGPFTVSEIVSPVAYRLTLPPRWNVYPVFHVSLLTPAHETPMNGPLYARPPPDIIDGEPEYEVERILDERFSGRARRHEYLVLWKGYPLSDASWEPASGVHAPDLVKKFKQTPKKKIKGRRVLLTDPSSSWPTHSPLNIPSSATPLPPTSCTLPSCPEDPAQTPRSSLSSLTPLHSPSPSESSDQSGFET